MKNIIVGQSGGPTAVINGSLYGVVTEGLRQTDAIETVFGMINGIEGFLNDQVIDMRPLSENGELERIRTTPGAYLGSCRYKLPEDLTDAVYPQLFEKFSDRNIGCFFYIGGNDSMALPSASFLAMPPSSRVISVSSGFQKRSIMTLWKPTTHLALEALQNM